MITVKDLRFHRCEENVEQGVFQVGVELHLQIWNHISILDLVSSKSASQCILYHKHHMTREILHRVYGDLPDRLRTILDKHEQLARYFHSKLKSPPYFDEEKSELIRLIADLETIISGEELK